MKRSNRILAIILVLSLSVSLFAFSASAANIPHISSFPEVFSGCIHYGYTKALQRFLMCLSPSNEARILASGGIDGIFGQVTYDLAVAYQDSRDLDADGAVGPYTWSQIASDLVYNGVDSLGQVYMYSVNKVWFKGSKSGRIAYYIFESNYRIASDEFHIV